MTVVAAKHHSGAKHDRRFVTAGVLGAEAPHPPPAGLREGSGNGLQRTSDAPILSQRLRRNFEAMKMAVAAVSSSFLIFDVHGIGDDFGG